MNTGRPTNRPLTPYVGGPINPPLTPFVTYNPLKPYVTVAGKDYKTYSGSDGVVYYKDGNNYVPIVNQTTADIISRNSDKTLSYNLNNNQALTPVAPTPASTPEPDSTPKPASSPSGGGGVDRGIQAELDKMYADNQKLRDQMEELLKPKVYSNRELAEIYDLQDMYNEDNIRRELDAATNQYYDDAIGTQEGLRTQSAGYSSQWLNQMLNDYLDSTQHSTPTASGQGANFANALMTQMNAGLINAENDYGMLQSVNQLGRDRAAESARNIATASDQYHNLGAYLQSVGADMNKSDVQAYAGQLGSLANMYASDRAYSSALAQAAATRYQGQASAAGTSAQAAGNAYNSALDKLWNAIYRTNNQNADYAYNYVYNQLTGGKVN